MLPYDWRERKSLIQDRAEWVEKLYWALKQRDRGSPAKDVQDAKNAIARMTHLQFRHANCLRSFERLFNSNPDNAGRYYREKFRKYLITYQKKTDPS